MSTPQVPPRPSRADKAAPTAAPPSNLTPLVPPRPSRKIERSASPVPERYAPSPLNELPPHSQVSDLRHMSTHNASTQSVDSLRPPSVNLPSVGQEGNEYADIERRDLPYQEEENELPLHAPKPSNAASVAKAQIAPVIRTDSNSAAVHNIMKQSTFADSTDSLDLNQALKPLPAAGRPLSIASSERPMSAQSEEQGIPHFGSFVPMYPNAGDVQAPSPSPYGNSKFSTSGDLQRQMHHFRRRSSQQVPPGSYGLHGHGMVSQDKFEKDWYAKHPEALKEEKGYHGLNNIRHDWALSSDDLNKIVDSSHPEAGFGTNKLIASMPDEQIGYLASEEYASRLGTPISRVETQGAKAPAATATQDEHTVHIDEPEERTSKYSGNGYDPPVHDLGPNAGNTDQAGGVVDEQGEGMPILASDEVRKRPGSSRLHPAMPPQQEHRRDGYVSDHDSDSTFASGRRTSKSRPTSSAGMHQLSRFVSHEHREGVSTPLEDVDEYEPLFEEDEKTGDKPINPAERFKHRPENRRRFPSQDVWEDTPNSARLEAEVDEAEQERMSQQLSSSASKTFEHPDVEASRKGEPTEAERAKLLSADERLAKSNFKPHLREDLRPAGPHRFPSHDVWEDSPDSASLTTELEDADTESGREAEKAKLLRAEQRQKHLKMNADLERETRPGMQPRFPSRDVWEDSPDSASLTTTLNDNEVDAGLAAGAVVTTTTDLRKSDPLSGSVPRENATAGQPSVPVSTNQPMIPARPKSKSTLHSSPLSQTVASSSPVGSPPDNVKVAQAAQISPPIPDRPKPNVPARPQKSASQEESETGAKAVVSPPLKSKPTVPSRPMGSKIAALQSGFMSDLNNRLKLGPQAPPKELPPAAVEPEVEEEKAPLADARKSRARGPARRAPAAATAAVPTPSTAGAKKSLSFVAPFALWEVSHQTQHGGATLLHKPSSSNPSVPENLVKPEVEGRHDADDTNIHKTVTNTEDKGTGDEPALLGPAAKEPVSNSSATESTSAVEEPESALIDSTEPSTDLKRTRTTSTSVQTGEMTIVSNPGEKNERSLTIIEGGAAEHEGTIVVDNTPQGEATQ